MPQKWNRSDQNQLEIIAALRKAGASVQVLSAVAKGMPDIAAGYAGQNWFLEVKNPSKPKADQKLTPDQIKWHAEWKGQVAVVYSVADALRVIGVEL